jgi:hypothetical protein
MVLGSPPPDGELGASTDVLQIGLNEAGLVELNVQCAGIRQDDVPLEGQARSG